MEAIGTGWVVDECPDANGHWTIRQADGTPNGNTELEPVATVYGLRDAERIALFGSPDRLDNLLVDLVDVASSLYEEHNPFYGMAEKRAEIKNICKQITGRD